MGPFFAGKGFVFGLAVVFTGRRADLPLGSGCADFPFGKPSRASGKSCWVLPHPPRPGSTERMTERRIVRPWFMSAPRREGGKYAHYRFKNNLLARGRTHSYFMPPVEEHPFVHWIRHGAGVARRAANRLVQKLFTFFYGRCDTPSGLVREIKARPHNVIDSFRVCPPSVIPLSFPRLPPPKWDGH